MKTFRRFVVALATVLGYVAVGATIFIVAVAIIFFFMPHNETDFEHERVGNLQRAYPGQYARIYAETVTELRKPLNDYQRLTKDSLRPHLEPSVVESMKAARAAQFMAADKVMQDFHAQINATEREYSNLETLLANTCNKADPKDLKYFKEQEKVRAALSELRKNTAALDAAWLTFQETGEFKLPMAYDPQLQGIPVPNRSRNAR